MKNWTHSAKKILCLHPLLFAIMPVLTLYSANLSQVAISQILRTMLVACVGTAAFLLILWFTLKNLEVAALVTSLLAILFFNYGNAYASAVFLYEKNLVPRGLLLDFVQLRVVTHTILFAIWALVAISGILLFKRAEVWRSQISKYFAILGIVAVLFQAINIVKHQLDLPSKSEIPETAPVNNHALQGEGSLPDIYYIIPDSYGRQDVLQEFYQFDNSPFLSQLQDLGFYVTTETRSNYTRTWLSLASTLNMNYMEHIIEFPSTDPECIPLVSQHIATGEVLQYLRGQGYQFFAIASNFEPTQIRTADRYIYSEWRGLNGFESLMLRNSFLALIYDFASLTNFPLEFPGYQTHRDYVHFSLEALAEMPEEPGPKFVFAHIVSPHPPFVFGPEGESVRQRMPSVLWVGDDYHGTKEEYIVGYKNQVTYINSRIQDLVQHLIEDSEMPPIIILQGDHGPKSSMEGRQVSYDVLKESMAILNAYYFPEGAYDNLYPSISPVNTFRVILNQFFNQDYDLLPDLAYFTFEPCGGDAIELLPEETELEEYLKDRGN